METSAPAPALEKKGAKSGLLEDSSFPDPGKKACPLAVAAAAAAVAAQGGTLSVLHAWRAAGVFFTRSLGFNECAGPCHLGGMLGLWRTVPLPRESQSPRRWLAAFFGELAIPVWWLRPDRERRKGGEWYWAAAWPPWGVFSWHGEMDPESSLPLALLRTISESNCLPMPAGCN